MLFSVTPENSGNARSRLETDIVEPLNDVPGIRPAIGFVTVADNADALATCDASRVREVLRYFTGSAPKLKLLVRWMPWLPMYPTSRVVFLDNSCCTSNVQRMLYCRSVFGLRNVIPWPRYVLMPLAAPGGCVIPLGNGLLSTLLPGSCSWTTPAARRMSSGCCTAAACSD